LLTDVDVIFCFIFVHMQHLNFFYIAVCQLLLLNEYYCFKNYMIGDVDDEIMMTIIDVYLLVNFNITNRVPDTTTSNQLMNVMKLQTHCGKLSNCVGLHVCHYKVTV